MVDIANIRRIVLLRGDFNMQTFDDGYVTMIYDLEYPYTTSVMLTHILC